MKEKKEERQVNVSQSGINSLGSSHGALFVGNKQNRSGPVCFYCGERGHVKRFCDEWKKKMEEQNKKETEVANMSYLQDKLRNAQDSDSDIECIALYSGVLTSMNEVYSRI